MEEDPPSQELCLVPGNLRCNCALSQLPQTHLSRAFVPAAGYGRRICHTGGGIVFTIGPVAVCPAGKMAVRGFVNKRRSSQFHLAERHSGTNSCKNG